MDAIGLSSRRSRIDRALVAALLVLAAQPGRASSQEELRVGFGEGSRLRSGAPVHPDGSAHRAPAADRPRRLRAIRVDGRRDARAVALGGERGAVGFGGPRGAWLRRADGGPPTVLLEGEVVEDLRFEERRSPAGDTVGAAAVWIATAGGLYRARPGAPPVDRTPAPGAAREARRLAAGPGGRLLVATRRGVFLEAPTGKGWIALDGGAPADEVTALAYAVRGGRLYWVTKGRLYRARLGPGSPRPRLLGPRRVALPGALGPVLDVVAPAGPGRGALALTRKALFQSDGAGGWVRHPLRLPPGAEAVRIVRGEAGELWLATARGLYRTRDLKGPWQADPSELGGAAIAAIAALGGELAVATDRGTFRLLPAEPAHAERPPVRALGLQREPGVRAVQRAALRHLELGRGPLRSLAARARSRGWLPVVELRGRYGGARRRDLERDETFSSGEPRVFFDRDRTRGRDFDVTATLRWDLGDTVYHPEELDVAKERREVIELRDEVLDEIAQLYFERRRVLLRLSARMDPADAESLALALRADELAAGLDAWTGGWWGARVPPAFGTRVTKPSPGSRQETSP